MKIIVLNGSPKGDVSVTMQYINYLKKKFTEHELKIINISQKIAQIEKDKTVFQDIIKEINSYINKSGTCINAKIPYFWIVLNRADGTR